MRLPRFYPILDTAILAIPLEAAAGILLEEGAQILQLRHKEHFSREMFETAGRVATLCRQAGALFVVNDRADLAALLDAAVHLGQEDLTPEQARRVMGSAVIGYSTHNEAQLRSSTEQPADYAALGPIFQTASKRNPDPVVGVPGLQRLRPLTARPLVAIGGITRENAASVLKAGADSVAVIGDLCPREGDRAALRERAREWIRLTNE
jgi:thiamine-phosphate pyrophosphorylase